MSAGIGAPQARLPYMQLELVVPCLGAEEWYRLRID